MPKRRAILRKRALRLNQDDAHPLYLLSLTARELFQVADISRLSRDDTGKLLGYQRPEVKRHVQDIVDYLNAGDVLFPNSIILALSSDIRFVRSRGPQVEQDGAVAGLIEVSLPRSGEQKPAWIVDGQQRALALSKSKSQDLPIPINAFVADEVDLQRDQFLRINNTRALPRGLITELLPTVTLPLPAKLAARKIPAALCEQLNTSESSPFFGLIRRASDDRSVSKAVIADTSMIKVLEESLGTSSGCLFPYRNMATGETDFAGIWAILITYWGAVKTTFPDAWGKPPTQSRLMHGTGIRAMGRLMDRVMGSLNVRHSGTSKQVERELALIKPHCRWTAGHWEGLADMSWNDLQNVPRHIQMLSSLLVRMYVKSKDDAA